MLTDQEKKELIQLIERGEPIPLAYKNKLFNPEGAEFIEAPGDYKLVYKGKTRKEEIIAQTPAAPFQKIRYFNSNPCEDSWNNMLIFGDNLMALKAIYEDQRSENRLQTKNKIKLIYIDPPFASKKDFTKDREKAYRDKIIGAQFIEFLRKRLILLREILADDGSIYVHLDSKKGHYIKAILDEIFGEENFLNEIIWHYTGGGRAKSYFSRKHDILLWYGKRDKPYFDIDSIRVPYEDSGYAKAGIKAANGKIYMPNPKGKAMDDVWYVPIVNPMSSERVDYPTQKPEELLKTVIEASCPSNGIVLDCFAGSGTTLSVAEKLGRPWIGIDCGKLAIYTIQKRILNLSSRRIGSEEKDNNEDSSGKEEPLKVRNFTLFNTGIYDKQEIMNMPWEHYKPFVAQLFGVRLESHNIHGFEADGYIGLYSAHIWDYPNHRNLILDRKYVETLHEALGGKAGGRFYIVAPIVSMSFMEDEIKFGITTYTVLKVPLSILKALIEKGEAGSIKQPTREKDINEVIDAVGFDFISQPEIIVKYCRKDPIKQTLANFGKKDFSIEISEFRSNTLIYDPEDFKNFETFSMVLVDTSFNGDFFNLEKVFWANKVINAAKTEAVIRISEEDFTGEKMMIIFIDKYGNELKTTKTKEDFECR